MDKQIVYLACPYSDPDWEVRQNRFEAATRAAGKLIKQGCLVFSPLTHSYAIAENCDIDPLDGVWYELSDVLLTNVNYDRLVVLKIDGWDKSVGVQREIAYADVVGLPVEYMEDET